jgi:hypothetical protein
MSWLLTTRRPSHTQVGITPDFHAAASGVNLEAAAALGLMRTISLAQRNTVDRGVDGHRRTVEVPAF